MSRRSKVVAGLAAAATPQRRAGDRRAGLRHATRPEHDDRSVHRARGRRREHDIENPELGGTLTLVLDGTEAPYLNKPDNTAIDSRGNLLIQEDAGGNDHLARIITRDEESSGIIEARQQLGRGVYLLDAQVHAPPVSNAVEYVERGQLLVMKVKSWRDVYGDDD